VSPQVAAAFIGREQRNQTAKKHPKIRGGLQA
jgi:hypothetical protein